MKKKFLRIAGVGLTIALLTSLMVMASPVSAGTAAWSAVTLPGATALTGNVIAAGTDVNLIATSPDGGTLFAADGASNAIFFSTNGGQTWTASTTPPAAAATAIAVSPAYATDSTVYVADTTGGFTLYKSANGGITFTQTAAAIAAQTATGIALSPNFAVDGLLVVSTTAAGGGVYGDVYILGAPGTFGLTAISGALTEDFTSVVFSPSFPSDRTILAVGSVAGAAGTVLHNNVNWTQAAPTAWDASWLAGSVDATMKDVGTAGGILTSSIALPSDYNGLDVTKRTAYVGTTSAVNDDVYRVAGALAGVNLNLTTAGTPDDAVATLAYSGTTAAGTLYAGDSAATQVYRSSNAPTAIAGLGIWLPATLAPTGATNTQVLLDPNFATSNTIYVGTTGAGAPDESAFSVSVDGGINFYQTGLIDTVINTILDVTPSPAYATDMTIFMVTEDGTAGPDSLWKTTNGGTNWSRVQTLALTVPNGIVRLSPTYAADATVVFADAGIGTTAIRKSTTGGASWTPLVSISPIADLLVADSSVTYVASAAAGGNVQKNIDGAWHWGAGVAGASALTDLDMAPNGDLIVGNTIGRVYRSIDGGLLYTAVGATIGAGGATLQVAVDSDYVNNSIIYAGDSAGTVGGIYRIDASTALITTPWTLKDADVTDPTEAGINPLIVAGIEVSSDGTLYAADSTAAAVAVAGASALTGGVVRSLDPTTTLTAGLVVTNTATFETLSIGDGLVVGDALQNLKMVPGSNMLFAVDNSLGVGLNRVLTYTDTLTGMTALSSPAYTAPSITALENIPALATPTTASLAWTAMTGATSYTVQVNTAATFLGTAQAVTYVAPATTATVAGMVGGTTYYWRVRAATPALSEWSTTWKFTTALPAVAPPAAVAVPALGATAVGTTPTFTWPAVVGATGYDFMISEDSTFSIIDYATTEPTNTHVVTDGLANETTYYWRVRPTSAASSGAWTAFSFTTMPEPTVVEPEQVIITEPGPAAPPPEVTIIEVPGPATITEQAIPSYLLWVIIGIGAVLLVALITLIVRTRRVA
ncbi:beta strand repeat-containing protein [Chloroflexota bacterium]